MGTGPTVWLLAGVWCALAGCQVVTIGPGPGVVSSASESQLSKEHAAAEADAAQRACVVASDGTGGVRLVRKALELTSLAVGDHAALATDARAWVDKLLPRALVDCDASVEAGTLLVSLADFARATDVLLGTASRCGSVAAALAVAGPARQTGRCAEAIAAVRGVWLGAPRAQWTSLLDAVDACSDASTLRANIAFAPPDAVSDYLAVLDRRAQAQAHADAVMACRQDCENGRQACESNCGGHRAWCENRCSAFVDTCQAGCN